MRRIGLAVPLPVHAAWREEPRVWRAVPSSRVRGDDKNQNVLVRGATDRSGENSNRRRSAHLLIN
jgi:hypothetical protein